MDYEFDKESFKRVATQDTNALIIESVKDYAIFMLDRAGYVKTWNAGAQHIKGYTASEIIGKHFSVFYPEEARAIGQPQENLKAAYQQGRYEEEAWRIRKDGSRFWADVVITAIYDGAELIGFVKVTRDLTERREAEIALQRSRDEAIAANQAKSRFLSIVSHEVRAPLTATIQLFELIALSLEGELKVAAITALDTCRWLLRILNDLLDASKLQAGAVKLELRSFAIRPIIDEICQLISPEATKKQLKVSWRIGADVPNCVYGDELRIRQILQNLALNAVKFTPSGGISIEVELLRLDEAGVVLKFVIQDTGIGISPEKQKKLFQPFMQAEDSTTRIYGGTGLGLSIAHTLVELMQGKMGVNSEPGKGSTFWVEIPFRSDLSKAA
jgi:osomolarity two-component system sensor histidine kinase TcsA